jgi:hypothetical protein
VRQEREKITRCKDNRKNVEEEAKAQKKAVDEGKVESLKALVEGERDELKDLEDRMWKRGARLAYELKKAEHGDEEEEPEV